MKKEVYRVVINPNIKKDFKIGSDEVSDISQNTNGNHVVHFKKLGIEIEIDYPKYIYRKVKE